MMYLGIAVAIVVAIIAIILLLVFVRFLFTNFYTSRVLSLGFAIASLVMAFIIAKGDEINFNRNFIIILVLTALSYMFFIGMIIFDVEFDGTFSISPEGEMTAGRTGGFLFNTLMSFFASGIVYGIFGLATDSPIVFFVVPLLLIVANGIFILIAVKNVFF